VGVALAAVTAALGLWALLWPVPTEVNGTGVLLNPDNAGILNARSGGQVRALRVAVGEPVRRGQVLLELYLPVLERELQQQRGGRGLTLLGQGLAGGQNRLQFRIAPVGPLAGSAPG
jgi:HlyD family secretion protein